MGHAIEWLVISLPVLVVAGVAAHGAGHLQRDPRREALGAQMMPAAAVLVAALALCVGVAL